jgi:hypothetical protein
MCCLEILELMSTKPENEASKQSKKKKKKNQQALKVSNIKKRTKSSINEKGE